MPVLDLRAILPTGFSWRELWLPEQINGLSLPSAVAGGHPLTLTNASKKTTADGVHGDGSANSNINCGAIHNAEAKWWFSFRFKLDSTFVGGRGDMYLFGKHLSDYDWIFLYLVDGDGALHFRYQFGGATAFNIKSAESSWTAGTSYHVLASISSVNAVRMRINNGVAITNADVNPAPNGGDVIIGHRVTATAGGIKGVITDFYMGTDDLTAAEETDLYNGIPPADATEIYLCDEGRGGTVYDRSVSGHNGTLRSACRWAFGSCQRPVLSLNGVSGYGQSSNGVDISGALTMVWVGKMKATYASSPLDRYLMELFIDNNNNFNLYYNLLTHDIEVQKTTGGGNAISNYSYHPAIDDYAVIIGTNDVAGVVNLHINGQFRKTSTLVNAMPGLAAIVYIGAEDSPANYDVSKPLLVGLINGALNATHVKELSRHLNDALNLGLVI